LGQCALKWEREEKDENQQGTTLECKRTASHAHYSMRFEAAYAFAFSGFTSKTGAPFCLCIPS
jgi:hypothetical protein